MGFAATRWAWSKYLRPNEKLVLLALADMANDRGECQTDNEHLMTLCVIPRTSLWRALQRLEQEGLFSRSKLENGTRQSLCHYRLSLDNVQENANITLNKVEANYAPHTFHPETDNPAVFQSETSTFHPETQPGQNDPLVFHPETKVFHSETLSRARVRAAKEFNILYLTPSAIALSPLSSNSNCNLTLLPKPEQTPKPRGKPQQTFETFWKSYPKKRKKKTAFEIWRRKHLETKLDIILQDIDKRRDTDRYWQDGFVPDPTTYLNQERWDDEITTARPRQSTRRKNGAEILAESCKGAFDPDV